MGFHSRNQRAQSCNFNPKSSPIYLNTYRTDFLISLVISLFLLGACSSIPTASNITNLVTQDEQEGTVNQLTESEESFEPFFSAKWNRLLFVRNSSQELLTPQIFQKDLVNKKESQITFNMGENHHPQIHPSQNIIVYSSSFNEMTEKIDLLPLSQELGVKTEGGPIVASDESKDKTTPSEGQTTENTADKSINKNTTAQENAPSDTTLKKENDNLKDPSISNEKNNSSEIFSHERNQEIYLLQMNAPPEKRITSHRGYDGLPTFSKDGKGIYFVRDENNTSTVFLYTLATKKEKALLRIKSGKINSLSVSGHYLAITILYPANGINYLRIFDIKTLKNIFSSSDQFYFADVNLHEEQSRALVTSNMEAPNNRDIYLIDFEKNCYIRLTYKESREQTPVFGPGGTSFFFVSNRSKSFQIYATLIRPELECKSLPDSTNDLSSKTAIK